MLLTPRVCSPRVATTISSRVVSSSSSSDLSRALLSPSISMLSSEDSLTTLFFLFVGSCLLLLQRDVSFALPTLKPRSPTESNLKHRALTEFHLIYNKFHKDCDSRFPEPRYVVPESETLDLIVNEHLQLLHAGRDKLSSATQRKYNRVNHQEVIFVLTLCKNYALNKPDATKALLVKLEI